MQTMSHTHRCGSGRAPLLRKCHDELICYRYSQAIMDIFITRQLSKTPILSKYSG